MPLKLFAPVQLASAEVKCWKCSDEIAVHALVASDLDDSGDDGYGRIGEAVFVYDVDEDEMPEALALALVRAYPNYRPLYSQTAGETTWANACSSCGALQGAFFLHAEPDGPFFGMPRDFRGELRALIDSDAELPYASFGLG